MDAAVKRAAPSPRYYQRRRPERTLWYRTVQAHFETWLALSTGQGDASPPAHVEQAFRRYLECEAPDRIMGVARCKRRTWPECLSGNSEDATVLRVGR